MLLLDLFSGTGSVAKAAVAKGYGVITLDRDLPAYFQTDIMDFDYRELDPHAFHFVWASPPCTEYSRAKTTGVRKIEEANEIVKRTLEIIEYLEPEVWVIENPQTGLLKEQDFMRDIHFIDVDYCKYGFPYRKRTRLWSNKASSLRLKPLCNKDCDSMDEGRKKHKESAQRLPHGHSSTWGEQVKHCQRDLYKIPEGLINDILDSAS